MDDCQIRTPRFFRQASNALLPFAVHLAQDDIDDRQDRHRLVAGIYIALMSGVFGSAEARMGGFARNHCRNATEFPLKDLSQLVHDSRRIDGLESLLSNHLDLALNIAHGGVTLDENPDELERDHIFPKALLTAKGVPERQINHYANFHFLRKKDNRNKTDKPPNEWFRKPGKSPPYTEQELEDRLLSWDLLEPDAFEKLLSERGQRIRSLALELFYMDEEKFNGLF